MLLDTHTVSDEEGNQCRWLDQSLHAVFWCRRLLPRLFMGTVMKHPRRKSARTNHTQLWLSDGKLFLLDNVEAPASLVSVDHSVRHMKAKNQHHRKKHQPSVQSFHARVAHFALKVAKQKKKHKQCDMSHVAVALTCTLESSDRTSCCVVSNVFDVVFQSGLRQWRRGSIAMNACCQLCLRCHLVLRVDFTCARCYGVFVCFRRFLVKLLVPFDVPVPHLLVVLRNSVRFYPNVTLALRRLHENCLIWSVVSLVMIGCKCILPWYSCCVV